MVTAGSSPASRLVSLRSRAAFAALLLGLAASLTAQDASRLEAEAKHAFDGGRFTEAGDKYAKAAEQTAPADRKAELYFQSGWAFFIGGRTPAARDSLRAAFTARPTLGIEADLYSPDFVKLARSVQSEVAGPQAPPVDINELKRTAREKLADGKAEEALYDLKKASNSTDPQIHRMLAEAYDRLGRPGDADFERKRATELEQSLVSSAPIGTPSALPPPSSPSPAPLTNSSAPLVEAAENAMRVGDYRSAQAIAHRALDADPRSAEAHRIAGDAALALGQDADAEREYTAAVVLDASNSGAELGLGRLAERQKKWNTAASHYRRALELNGKNVAAAIGLGHSMEEVDKTAARIAYGRAIEIDPSLPEARNDFGVFLLKNGEPDRAISELIEAVRVAPQKAVFHENLGRAYRRQQKWREAERELSDATRLAPNDTAAWATLGSLRMELKKFEEAATAYRAAFDLDPTQEEAASGLGTALANAGRLPEAEQALTKALETIPKSAVLWNDLGVVRSMRGSFSGAVDAFHKALAFDPANEPAKTNLARAEQLAALDRAAG
jgi:tetratricopeptide (TPR) repeat protein